MSKFGTGRFGCFRFGILEQCARCVAYHFTSTITKTMTVTSTITRSITQNSTVVRTLEYLSHMGDT